MGCFLTSLHSFVRPHSGKPASVLWMQRNKIAEHDKEKRDLEQVARERAQPSSEKLGGEIALDLEFHRPIGVPGIQPAVHGPICDEERVCAADQY